MAQKSLNTLLANYNIGCKDSKRTVTIVFVRCAFCACASFSSVGWPAHLSRCWMQSRSSLCIDASLSHLACQAHACSNFHDRSGFRIQNNVCDTSMFIRLRAPGTTTGAANCRVAAFGVL